jgi:glycosyltransferase involved in cell wall biosynthesis
MLSVAIITFNEEKNIERCLNSIATIADEIIIVDSNSTDKTKELCTKYLVKFYTQPFLGYLEQKKLATTYCTHDFVLSLDADECLSPQLIQSIQHVKANNFYYDAFTMNRLSNFCGKWIRHGTWYPDRKLRLFNKQKGNWAGSQIHENIQMKSHSTIAFLKGDLHHYSYNSIEEVLTQNNKYTSLQVEEMFAKGKKSSWFKIIVNPMVAFINGYIFKRGFLDGWDGYFIAKTIAYFTMVKYIKLLRLQQKKTTN